MSLIVGLCIWLDQINFDLSSISECCPILRCMNIKRCQKALLSLSKNFDLSLPKHSYKTGHHYVTDHFKSFIKILAEINIESEFSAKPRFWPCMSHSCKHAAVVFVLTKNLSNSLLSRAVIFKCSLPLSYNVINCFWHEIGVLKKRLFKIMLFYYR